MVSIFQTWGNSRLATKIRLRQIESAELPARFEKRFNIGIVVNLMGIAVTLLSAEQVVGMLIARALSMQGLQNFAAGPAAFAYARQAIKALDIFIVQANTNILASHFLSLASQLWLQRRLPRFL